VALVKPLKKGASIMNILNFIIALVALIIAVMAFQRTGGIKDLRKTTAELLAKMEKRMREEEAAKVERGKTEQ
jgi:anaerobic C4-dicarboxylate transporter